MGTYFKMRCRLKRALRISFQPITIQVLLSTTNSIKLHPKMVLYTRYRKMGKARIIRLHKGHFKISSRQIDLMLLKNPSNQVGPKLTLPKTNITKTKWKTSVTNSQINQMMMILMELITSIQIK